MSIESPTWKHSSIQRSLQEARSAVEQQRPILIYLYDQVKGKSITALAYYEPTSHQLIIEGPADKESKFSAGEQFPITLHGLETVYQVIATQSERGGQPPELVVSARNSGGVLEQKIAQGAHTLIKIRLTVRPTTAHRVIFHKGARSNHIDVEQVMREYLGWLWQEYQQHHMAEFPVHALLSFRPNGNQPSSKNEVQFNRGEVDDPHFNMLNAGRIKWNERTE